MATLDPQRIPSRDPMTSRAGHRLPVLLWAGIVTASSGCSYDPDAPCGKEMQLSEHNTCVCPDGTTTDPDGGCMVACGPNEVRDGEACVCADGFSRSSANAPCAESIPGLGVACEVGGDDCVSPFVCVEETGDPPYCTIAECDDTVECVGGYACVSDNQPSYCLRPPVGQGSPCSDADDCAGGEATYCDTFQTGSCLVADCTLVADDCFPGWKCCDFSAVGFNTLCIEADTCPFGR